MKCFLGHMKWWAMVPELMGRGSREWLTQVHQCASSDYPRRSSNCDLGSGAGILMIANSHTGRNCVSVIQEIKGKIYVYDMRMSCTFWMFWNENCFELHLLYDVSIYWVFHSAFVFMFKTVKMMLSMVLQTTKTRVGRLHQRRAWISSRSTLVCFVLAWFLY
jgi:hypothetical protein